LNRFKNSVLKVQLICLEVFGEPLENNRLSIMRSEQPCSKRQRRNAALSDGAQGHQFSGGGTSTQVQRRAFCALARLICALRRAKIPSNQSVSTVAKLFASVVPGRASVSQLRPAHIISGGNCWCDFGTSAASLAILQVDDDDQLSDPTTTEIRCSGSTLLKVWRLG
jgi:hypothetical protein